MQYFVVIIHSLKKGCIKYAKGCNAKGYLFCDNVTRYDNGL